MTALFVVASRTGWTLTELRALPRSELFHYVTLVGKSRND